MTLADGKDLSRWEGGLYDRNNANSVSLIYRTIAIFTEVRALGIWIELNEAGRPLGVPGDRAIGRAGLSSIWTASGLSTVFYQKGREDAGLTPSAADPYGVPSRHMLGLAIDVNCSNYAVLDRIAERHGMRRTISSEIWHYEIYRESSVPAAEYSRYSKVVNGVFQISSLPEQPAVETTEQREERELMGAREDIREDTRKLLAEFLGAEDIGEQSPLFQGIVGRIDREVAPTLRGGVAIVGIKGTGGQWLVSIPAGYKRHLTGDEAAMLKGAVTPVTVQWVEKERFDLIIELVDQRMEQLGIPDTLRDRDGGGAS